MIVVREMLDAAFGESEEAVAILWEGIVGNGSWTWLDELVPLPGRGERETVRVIS